VSFAPLLRRVTVPAAAAALAAGLWAVPAAVNPAAAAAALPEPSAEALPTLQVDKGVSGRDGAVVWSQAIVGNTVYAGGDFTVTRPAGAKRGTSETPRTHLLAYDITTGNLITSFNHTLNGQVRGVAASPDGSRVYITGDFTTVDGKERYRLAAFKTADGSLVDNFRPVLGSAGLTVAATNSTVYVGGNFSKVGSKPGAALENRKSLAAFAAADGAVTGFKADANAPVTALAVTVAGDRVAVGGRFTTLSGTSAYGLGSVHPSTGAAQSFPVNNYVRNAGNYATITSLYADSTGIYGTGYVQSGGNLEGTFRADSNGQMLWVADCYGDSYSVVQTGGVVYDASHHHDCASTPGGFREIRPRYQYANAYTVEATGTDSGTRGYGWTRRGQPAPTMLNWYPDFLAGKYTGQGPWSVVGNSRYVSYGGEFQAVNSKSIQQGLVRFAVPGGGGANAAPTASFTFKPTNLAVSFDGSTSSAPGGTIKTYAWNFGDGTTGTGVKPSRTYAAAGTYTVTLTVTDNRGATGTTTAQVTVAQGGAGAAQASDAFSRTTASGWGTAPQGGAWKPDTKPAYFSTNGSRGLITIPTAGWTSQARLDGTNSADTDVSVSVGVTKRPSTAVTRAWVSARTSSDFKSGYLLRANVKANGQVESLQVIRRVAGTDTVIGTAAGPGVTLGTDDLAQLRLRVVGTTIQGKVWKAGAAEPAAWQVQVTDTSVRSAGSVGVGAYTGASASPLPVVVAFDNFTSKAG
jgi:PKD repeat protein